MKEKARLHAAACLRVLALTEGLPEVLSSASAIPALVDGLKSGSPLMKSICGGTVGVDFAFMSNVRHGIFSKPSTFFTRAPRNGTTDAAGYFQKIARAGHTEFPSTAQIFGLP